MKRFLCVLMTAVMCISLAGTAFAATASPEQKHRRSINRTTGSIIGFVVDEEGNALPLDYKKYEKDIIITPAGTAEESTKISSELKEDIKQAYNKLANNVIKLADVSGLDRAVREFTNGKKTTEDLVITDVFNVSVQGTELKGLLRQTGAGLRLNLNVGSAENTYAEEMVKNSGQWVNLNNGSQNGGFTAIMVYRNGQWMKLENTIVNKDGTVTCVLQDGDTVAIVKEGQTESGKFFDRVVSTVKNAVKNMVKGLFSLF